VVPSGTVPIVGGRRTGAAALLAGVFGAVVLVSGGSAAPGGYHSKAASLRSEVSALDARAQRALLDLYALDTRLTDAQARLGSLQAQAARLRAERALLAQQVTATRRTLTVSQRQLAHHLRALYEQGDTDPLAVMLGAKSLDDAMTELDDLTRVADQNSAVADVATTARERLQRLGVALAARRARLRASISSAQRAASELVSARAQRLAFVADLRSRQQLDRRQIGVLESAAQQVEKNAAALQAAPAPATPDSTDVAATAPAPAPGADTLTVVATGYSLTGQTATGAPAGPGVVAVDPSVIPLGTRLTIPGYGEGVAADTGVTGSSIDLWFPTLAQAHAWGRRTVTITLH
jgi:3D (Asp-Asp-Asp) domain-containing protein